LPRNKLIGQPQREPTQINLTVTSEYKHRHSPPASPTRLPQVISLSQLPSIATNSCLAIKNYSLQVAYQLFTVPTHQQTSKPSSCLSRKLALPLPPRRPLSTPLMVHSKVSFSVNPRPRHDPVPVLESRVSADYFSYRHDQGCYNKCKLILFAPKHVVVA